MVVGLFAGERWTPATWFVVLGALSGFLIRQPVTIAVKVFSGRRGRQDLPAAAFWGILYTILGMAAVAGMFWQQVSFVFLLAVPGAPVFAWHLLLVARREERRQPGVEIVATGVLSLAAPAMFWAAKGAPDPTGWWLFFLSWLQSAASIVYAYARLEQRELKAAPDTAGLLRLAWRALLYTTFNCLLVGTLGLLGWLPVGLVVPFIVQWLETLWGAFHPALRARPAAIGFRQLFVSVLFTLLFVVFWRW